MKTHLITANIDEMPACVQKYRDQLEGRSMLVKKLSILPIEAIVRGYITGMYFNFFYYYIYKFIILNCIVLNAILYMISHHIEF